MLRFICGVVGLLCVVGLNSWVRASPPIIKYVTINPSADAELHVSSSAINTTGGTLTAGEGDWIVFKFPLTNRPNTGDIISSQLVLTASTQIQGGFPYSKIVTCGTNWNESSNFATVWGQVNAVIAGFPDNTGVGNTPTYAVDHYGGCYAIYVDGPGQVIGRSRNHATESNWPRWEITYSDEDAGPGDANADGHFNSTDLVLVFAAGKYEQDVYASWEQGDWNGDTRFNSSDLVAAFVAATYEDGDPAVAWAELNE